MFKRILITAFLFSSLLLAQNNNNLINKFALAQSFEQAGQFEKAAKLYGELYEANPGNNVYFMSLNRVYVQLKNYAASVDLIEHELTRRKNDINLYGMLGSTYYMMGNENKAFNVWDKALTIAGPNSALYRTIASYAVERRAFEKAIDIYKKGKAIAQDKIFFSYDLGQLYTITMQFGNTAEEYCSILSEQPQQLQTIETKMLANANKPDALKQFITVVEKHVSDDNLSLTRLLAKLYVEGKEYEKAYNLYLNIDEKQSGKGQELKSYADFLLGEKQYRLSQIIYEKILEKYPDSQIIPSTKLGYAKCLEAILMDNYLEQVPVWKPYYELKPYNSPEVEKVITAFKEIAQLYKNSEVAYEAMLRIGMIKFYLQNDQQGAKSYLNKIVDEARMSQHTAEAYEELGNIALINGDLTEAEKDLNQILSLPRINKKDLYKAKYNLAKISFYNNDLDQTKKLLSEVIKNLKDDNANDALELSLLMNSSKYDSSNLVLFANAEFLTDQKKFNEAAKKYDLIAGDPKAFILHSIASFRYAEMQLALGDYQQSIELFEKVVQEGEKNIYADKALYLLGKIYEKGIGDDSKAIEMYEKLLAKFPSSIYLDEARREINKLKDKIS